MAGKSECYSGLNIILFCTNSDEAGAPRHVEYLAQELAAEFNVTVVLGGNGPVLNRLKKLGISCLQIGTLSSTFGIINNLKTFLEFCKIANTLKPDLIHCHSSIAGFIGRLYCAIYKKTCVFTVHGWGWRGPNFFKRIIVFLTEFFLARISNANYIFIDNNSLLSARQFLRINERQLSFIPNGVPDFGPIVREPQTEELSLLMAARVCDAKDHETLVRAFELAKLPCILYLVGHGTDSIDFQNKIILWAPTKNGLIRLMGQVSDVETYLAKADVYCLISNFEALPISIIEAMASGLPVLASDVGDCRKLVSNGVNGYVVSTKDPLQLASRIEALGPVDGRWQMGQASRQKYLSKYTVTCMARRVEELYTQISKN